MTDKDKLTQEELDALKAELKKEIMNEMKNDEQPTEVKSLPSEEVKPQPTEFKIPPKSKIDKFDRNISNNTESRVENVSSSSNIILIIVLIILAAGIYFVPKVSEILNKNKHSDPTPTEKKEEEPEEKIKYVWDSEIIKGINLPIMRNDKYSTESYYNNDSMTIEKFTNNDILYNAFVNIFSGNIAAYTEGYNGTFCGNENQRKTFNAKYINARVNNMFTKNAKFTLEDFYVPLSANTDYVGAWRYDANHNRYIYYGECNKVTPTGSQYIDILVEDTIKTSDDANTAYLTYAVGFVKVTGNNYEVYSDSAYTNKILEGTLNTTDYEKELKDILADSKKDLKKYQYEYSKVDCSYSELCYISGKWINE